MRRCSSFAVSPGGGERLDTTSELFEGHVSLRGGEEFGRNYEGFTIY